MPTALNPERQFELIFARWPPTAIAGSILLASVKWKAGPHIALAHPQLGGKLGERSWSWGRMTGLACGPARHILAEAAEAIHRCDSRVSAVATSSPLTGHSRTPLSAMHLGIRVGPPRETGIYPMYAALKVDHTFRRLKRGRLGIYSSQTRAWREGSAGQPFQPPVFATEKDIRPCTKGC